MKDPQRRATGTCMHCGQPAEMCIDCGVLSSVVGEMLPERRADTIEECAKVMDKLALKWREHSNVTLDVNHQWMKSRICIARAEAYEHGAAALRALKAGAGRDVPRPQPAKEAPSVPIAREAHGETTAGTEHEVAAPASSPPRDDDVCAWCGKQYDEHYVHWPVGTPIARTPCREMRDGFWKSETESPPAAPGERCQNCGNNYLAVYSIPDEVWARISPRRNTGWKSGGLLCLNCADNLARDAGMPLVWTGLGWTGEPPNRKPPSREEEKRAFDEHLEQHRRAGDMGPPPTVRDQVWGQMWAWPWSGP